MYIRFVTTQQHPIRVCRWESFRRVDSFRQLDRLPIGMKIASKRSMIGSVNIWQSRSEWHARAGQTVTTQRSVGSRPPRTKCGRSMSRGELAA
jgi:hypothetical protein